MEWKRKALILTLLSLSLFIEAYPQDSVNTFADYLFKKENYSSAITEYQRILYLNEYDTIQYFYYNLQIAKCNYLSDKYKEAISYITDFQKSEGLNTSINSEFNNYIGLSFLKLGYYNSAINQFNIDKTSTKAKILTGITYLHKGNWQKAEDTFSDISINNNYISNSEKIELINIAKQGNFLKTKSPVLSGFLSVVPGLGYAYTKHYQTAFSSLLLNVLLIGTAYELYKNNFNFSGCTLYVIGISWYIGNIFGSVNSAKRYNNKIINDYLDEDIIKHHLK